MSIGRFTDIKELVQVFENYIKTLAATSIRPTFNGMKLITADDDSAVLFFDFSTSLFSPSENEAEIIEQKAVLPIKASQQIIDVIAHLLAQKTDPQTIPSKLKLCMGVCHDNMHWTGLSVAINNFQEIYNSVHNNCLKKISFEASKETPTIPPTEAILFNRCRNEIYEHLNMDLKDDFATAFILLDNIGSENIAIDHFDSMNSRTYASRVDLSLKRCVQAEIIPKTNHLHCSNQKGNTCGDHTVINLFLAGVYDEQAILNTSEESATSQQLRDLTNFCQKSTSTEDEIKEMAKILLLKARNGKEPLSASIPLSKIKNPDQDKFEDFIIEQIETIFREHPEQASRALIDAENNYSDNHTQSTIPAIETLKTIFDGKKIELYFSFISEDYREAYCTLAKILARDTRIELEAMQLIEGKMPVILETEAKALKDFADKNKKNIEQKNENLQTTEPLALNDQIKAIAKPSPDIQKIDGFLLELYQLHHHYQEKLESETYTEINDKLEILNEINNQLFANIFENNPQNPYHPTFKTISTDLKIKIIEDSSKIDLTNLGMVRTRGRNPILCKLADMLWRLIDFVTGKRFERVEGVKLSNHINTLFNMTPKNIAEKETPTLTPAGLSATA